MGIEPGRECSPWELNWGIELHTIPEQRALASGNLTMAEKLGYQFRRYPTKILYQNILRDILVGYPVAMR
jgi:hypothetical protein